MSENKLLGPIYAEHLNTKFRCLTDGAPAVELELVRIDEMESPPGHEQFSLIFRAPLEMPPLQNTYRLEHDRLGAEDIFLVPIGRDREGVYFEAAFNRFLD